LVRAASPALAASVVTAARPRGEITVLDVVSSDPLRTPVVICCTTAPAPRRRNPNAAALLRLFDEVDEGIRATLASVTLDTLVR
jgi:DNA-binding IscR family transcriptional regulator